VAIGAAGCRSSASCAPGCCFVFRGVCVEPWKVWHVRGHEIRLPSLGLACCRCSCHRRTGGDRCAAVALAAPPDRIHHGAGCAACSVRSAARSRTFPQVSA
jgi:hypothetical protein